MIFPDLSDIPDGVKATFQILVWTGILYYYFKNRKKKIESDQKKIDYSVAVFMGVFASLIISMVVILFICGDAGACFDHTMNDMFWILMILALTAICYMEYRFWKKKKHLS